MASLSDVTTTSSTPDPGPDYGLADDDAARLLHTLLVGVREGIERGELERGEALVQLSDGVAPIAERYPGVRDTTVRVQVQEALNPALEANGWEPLTAFEW